MKKIILYVFLGTLLCFFVPNIKLATQADSADNAGGINTSVEVGYAKAGAIALGEAGPVTRILTKRDFSTDKNGEWVNRIYKICLSAINIIAAGFLIFVALANIAHFDIQKNAIKVILPRLVGAIVVANLSMPIIALASRAIDSLNAVTLFQPLGVTGWTNLLITGHIPAFITGAGIGLGIAVLASMFTGVAWIGYAIVGLILLVALGLVSFVSVMLMFRPFIVLLFAAAAPIAIICYVLPQTSKYLGKWLKVVVFWLVFPALANLLLRLALMIPSGSAMSLAWFRSGDDGVGIVSGVVGWFVPMAIRLAALWYVVRMPFKLEGDIAGLITKPAKWLGGNAWKWGAGYGMGLGAYEMEKKYNKQIEDKFGIKKLAGEKGITEDAARDERLGTGRTAERAEYERLKGKAERWGKTQKWNPYGIAAAIKERQALIDKGVAKAYNRNSWFSEKAMGDEAWLKHQQEIQGSDFSKVYTSRDVMANMDKTRADFIEAWVKAKGGDTTVDKEWNDAGDEITKKLRDLDQRQAASIDYLLEFEKCLGNGLGLHNLANLIEGFNRLQYVEALEQRSNRGKDAAAERDKAVDEVMRRRRDTPTPAPGPATSTPSGSPAEPSAPEPVSPAQNPDEKAQGESTQATAELVQAMQQLAARNQSPHDMIVQTLSAQSAILDKISPDGMSSINRQADQKLTALLKKLPQENAQQLLRRIRENGGLIGPDDLGADQTDENAQLSRDYNATKLAQISLLAGTDDSKSSIINAQKLTDRISAGVAPAELDETIGNAVRALTSPSAPGDAAAARQSIAGILGVGEGAITPDEAIKLARGAEVAFIRDAQGQIQSAAPADIGYRAAIQQQRDIGMDEIGVHSIDLARKMTARRQKNLPLINEPETIILKQKVEAIVEPHMQLRYSDQWRAQSQQMREKLISDVTESLEGALTGVSKSTAQQVNAATKDISDMIRSSQNTNQLGFGIGQILPNITERLFQQGLNNGPAK